MARKSKPPPTMVTALTAALDEMRNAYARARTPELLPYRDEVMRIGKEIAALEAQVIVAMKDAEQAAKATG